jgi:tRNA-binding protein
MFIATYNHHVGDVLTLLIADACGEALGFERRENYTRIFRVSDGLSVAWNVFDYAASADKTLTDGQQRLTADDIAELNAKNPFDEPISADNTPKIVVAQIVELTEHPDSDHLHICQVDIGTGNLQQIVCGAPNVYQGMKTVAALPGAMMPDGKLIFRGKLRGIDSFGMLCSARELALPNAPQVRGIIELTDNLKNGTKFEK